MNPELEDRIRSCPTLPALPEAALHVLELTQRDDVGLDELSKAIELDPALSDNLLRSLNSSFYNLSQKVGDIRQGVALLGVNAVKTLILSFSLSDVMKSQTSKGFNRLAFWRRCMYSAAAARVLAARVLPERAEDCFVAALLMDLGTLVLDRVLGEEYAPLYGRAKNHSDLPAIEHQALGLSHAEAGAILARHWRLPPLLEIAMAAHHRPDSVNDEPVGEVAQVISLASRCADVFSSERPAEAIAVVRAALRERFAIDDAAADALLVEVGAKTAQLAPLFEVRLNSTNYENILERSSQRLLELSLGAVAAEPASPANRRRAARMRREGRMFIISVEGGVAGRRSEIRLRDLSACGLGLISPRQMTCGSRFVIQLPAGNGQTKSLLYAVVRCLRQADGSFEIGARLSAVLAPEAPLAPAAA